jgi:hypothetical protein
MSMKSLIRTFKFAMVTWLCLFALVDSRNISALVFCFGPEGHIALEPAHDDSAEKGYYSCVSPRSYASGLDESHRGKCTDVGISISSLDPGLPGKAIASSCVSAYTALLGIVGILPRIQPVTASLVEASQPPTNVLVSVRSVVILV